MKVLSLFDGIVCARVALDRVGIPVETYYASEIAEEAIFIARKNYPHIRHIGNVKKIKRCIPGRIDLLIGGSPCQDLSIGAKKRTGLIGERSSLFWEYARVLKEANPKYFIFENVASMTKESKDVITSVLGVECILIDAALVSAQKRKRLFWTNILNVVQPKYRGIVLKDILLSERAIKEFSPYSLMYKYTSLHSDVVKNMNKPVRLGHFNKGGQACRVYSIYGKSITLLASGGGMGGKTGLYKVGNFARKLEPIECERLQGLNDNYTEGISASKRLQVLGDAFNVDVIAHILSFIS